MSKICVEEVSQSTPASCDKCPQPGVCCKDFVLSGGGLRSNFRTDSPNWQEAAEAQVAAIGLPFKPLRLSHKRHGDDGHEYGSARYFCPLVTEDGRCGNYANRPQLCQAYAPGTDAMCAMHKDFGKVSLE